MEDKLIEETFEEHYKDLVPLLKLTPYCESANNGEIHEWIKHN
jgi:hypothetical protein